MDQIAEKINQIGTHAETHDPHRILAEWKAQTHADFKAADYSPNIVDNIFSQMSVHSEKGIYVEKDLDLVDFPISILPDNLSTDGYVNLRGTSVTNLPDSLSVGGFLDLRGTNVTTLPDSLSVSGYLAIDGTSINFLPDGLSVGGDLIVSQNLEAEADRIKAAGRISGKIIVIN